MNAIDSFDGSMESADINLKIDSTNIIKDTGVASKFYPKKEKKTRGNVRKGRVKSLKKEPENELEEEIRKKLEEEIREKLEETLGNLYDDGVETWTMYGILICEDKQEQQEQKYEFYYDPINEAVADSECKIIGGWEKQVVRTGHGIVDGGEHIIIPNKEETPLCIKVLDEKIGIYQFYFEKGDKLRELIDK
jgi:hypothetical protein